jgi:hypothetical protein
MQLVVINVATLDERCRWSSHGRAACHGSYDARAGRHDGRAGVLDAG